MYCSVKDVEAFLQKIISIGSNNLGTPEPGRLSSNCNTANKSDHYSPKEVIKHIRNAELFINSRLTPYYVTPLRKVKSYEACLKENVTAGSNISVQIRDDGPFSLGQTIRFQDSCDYEDTIIKSVNGNTLIVESLSNNYSKSDTYISIIDFPAPIPVMTARMAASYLIAKLFTAEQSPDISTYDKFLRNETKNDMDNLMTGQILLMGQDLRGRRFVRGELFDGW
jgi:hypothetical protein